MIEQGIAMLIDTALSSAGGTLLQAPKNAALPTWTYQKVSDRRWTALQSPTGLSMLRLQIDCYGNAAADVVTLSKQIRGVLNGFRGPLPDPDATYVDSAFQSDERDAEYNPDARNWRRVMEFEICYAAN